MFDAIGVVSGDRKTVRIWAVLSWTTSSWTSKALEIVSGRCAIGQCGDYRRRAPYGSSGSVSEARVKRDILSS